MRLKDIGEFDLIELMARTFRREPADFLGITGSTGLIVGIGDDAAVWSAPSSGFTIATTDAMVEGTHFTSETASWYELGWKAMVSNISDIAGMGGIPRYALAVLGTSGDRELDDILQLCQGMADAAQESGASVVGGDTVSSPVTTISITLVGEALDIGNAGGKPSILSRYAARPGDAIAVTGVLGSSAGGLELLLKGPVPIPDTLIPLVEAHRRPSPRVKAGQALVQAGVRCGMDISDGLAGDLLRICKASGVAARIEVDKLPLDPALEQTFGARALEMALYGGEDYELLCTAPRELLERARSLLREQGTVLTVVGEVVKVAEGRVPLLLALPDGRLVPPARSGWEHFTADVDAARR